MKEKVYVAYKPNTAPHLLVKWGKGDEYIDLTDGSGLTYFEDEVGFYYWRGELVCDAN